MNEAIRAKIAHNDARAYAWENSRVDFSRNTGLVFKLPQLWLDAGRRSILRVSMLPPFGAAYHTTQGRGHLLTLPAGCGDALALHEMAHALAQAKLSRHPWTLPHGPIWAHHYIDLLAEHMGADAPMLRATYQAEVLS